MKKSAIESVSLGAFVLVFTFFSLWLSVFMDQKVETALAFVLILSFGVLHGANDIKLIQAAKEREGRHLDFKTVLVYYSIFIFASAAVFVFLPSFALLMFVLFSGYHFGEQHWVDKAVGHQKWAKIFYLVYGLLILFLLFNAHAAQVADVVQSICGHWLPQVFFKNGLYLFGALSLGLGAFLFIKKALLFHVPKQLFFVLVLFVLFETASLLWGFAIYFVFWHSLPSMVDQITFLYGGVRAATIRKYVWSSLPYWLASVIGMGVVLYVFRENLVEALAFFFAFLAAITFPHVLVIGGLNKKRKEQP
ncbi:Brp/Blh family beta-carotene 15,15'-dioxygenase [Maribacter sp. 2307ULW6-5]|uniref:Brp/Blh family beta-carotene 15,15'-dioxygenase n=1 Tax=Maribacter sp. 2307ULW6-5 TaxID=3386275 RepID=UPI0039BD116F